MKEYDVKITETLEKTVTVEAKSRADAEEQVRSAYYNSEYILDSENFTGVEFGTTEEREIPQEQAETMTVLLVKPHMYPQQVQIGCDLEDSLHLLQELLLRSFQNGQQIYRSPFPFSDVRPQQLRFQLQQQ